MSGKKKRGRPTKKKTYHLSKPRLEQRRVRVLEMRLAGIGPVDIAEELKKIPEFANTRPDTVWNDVRWWEKQGKITTVAPEVVTPDIYFNARTAITIQATKANKRFLVFQDQFDKLAAELRAITEEYPNATKARKGKITARKKEIETDLAGLQKKAIRETRLILSIIETLTDIPKKLGLILDRADIAFHDMTEERMVEAIQNEQDPERAKELIRAAELFAGII